MASTAMVVRENNSLRERIKNMRIKTKEAGEKAQKVVVGGVSCLAVGALTSRFLKDEGETVPMVKSVPVVPVTGAVTMLAGWLADSEPLSNAGEAVLYYGLGHLGEMAGQAWKKASETK